MIVEDSSVMGVTQQMSAISTNEGDMDTGGGGAEGGASLLGNEKTLEPRNPFGGSPYSSRLNQSSVLVPNSTVRDSGVTMVTTGIDSSSRQLLGNGSSELNALVTTLNDRVYHRLPDITSLQMSDSNSTQQQRPNGNGTGTNQAEFGSTMSPDDLGMGNIYPS